MREAEFRSENQYAEQLNMVAKDQYNQFVKHVHERRESFLREIAGARTRARWIITAGMVTFLVGLGIGIGVFRQYMVDFIDEWECLAGGGNCSFDDSSSPFGPIVSGMPLILIAMALTAGGLICMLVGFVLHIVAASRRRYVESSLGQPPAILPPWPPRA
ncbi:hypothetical protein [Streptomyces sp. NPDC053542]|uniref:hypothetical protein n=1 Tax=Streptomyces sp. NPDC053542 TaxID=3365710 RepID=UPI0037D69DD3